jgi:hypothetical protein
MVNVGPEDVTAAVLAWQAGKAVAPRVLGPTADYLGERLLDSVKAAENLSQIFVKAYRKLGSNADQEGAVPPRVLRAILDEGPFCDDELCAEYLSGLLASSRTTAGKDEESLSLLSAVSRLPNTALLLHFSAYRALLDNEPSSTDSLYAIKVTDIVSNDRLLEWTMEANPQLSPLDAEEAVSLITSDQGRSRTVQLLLTRLRSGIVSLQRERLVDDVSMITSPVQYRKSFADRSLGENRFVFSHTHLGFLLFTRLHGHRGNFDDFVPPDPAGYDAELPQPRLERLSKQEADALIESMLG